MPNLLQREFAAPRHSSDAGLRVSCVRPLILSSAAEDITAQFVEVESSAGDRGTFGPIRPEIPANIFDALRRTVIGCELFDAQGCWDRMFAARGAWSHDVYLPALGAFDCALWDLRGRVLGRPVCELLSNSVREEVPCYATLLGFDPDGDDAAAIARSFRDRGYRGQKWRLRDGPRQGKEGMQRNRARAAKLREAAPTHPLMFDVLGGWTLDYATEMCALLRPFDIAWIEEPLPAHDIAGYARLASQAALPIAAGEHVYGRAANQDLLSACCLKFLQTDVAWCGGITEAIRIREIAEAHGVPLIPHGASFLPALHLAAASPQACIPMLEYHATIEPKRQFFYAHKAAPARGYVRVPREPGLGIVLEGRRCVQ